LDAACEKLDDGLLATDPETEARFRRVLAWVYFELGDVDQAARQLRENVALHETHVLHTDRAIFVPADVSPSIEAAMFESFFSLGYIAAYLDRTKEAARFFEEALVKGSEAFGSEHPYLQRVNFYLGVLANDPAQVRAAIDAYAPYLDQRYGWTEASETEKGSRLVGYIQMLIGAGDLIEAEPYCRQLLDSNRKAYGEEHLFVGYASQWLALSLEAQGQLAEAEVLLRRAERIVAESLHDEAPDVAHVSANLGRILAKQGELAEAERTLREALRILDIQNPWIWLYNDACSTLGGVLAEKGDYAEAEPLLLQSYEELTNEPMAWPHRQREALERIVRLYDAWGKPDQAAEWRSKLTVPPGGDEQAIQP
jgi:tetratricopeptide (TPR) repeat protein